MYKMYDKPIDRMKEAFSSNQAKYAKEHYALDNISFHVNKGDNIGILGTNGSGKSTVLKIITGVLNPTSGVVEVNGKISALLELGAGFNPEYTGMENIYLNGTMMGYSKEEIDKKVEPILTFADIGDFINRPIKTYSSGMFARLAFAVAINVEPEILIVDEALSVGDMQFQIKCLERMKKMMEGGTTVLFVSHDINSIRRFCKRAIWLDKGKLIKQGEVNSVCDAYTDFLKVKNKETEEVKDEQEVAPVIDLNKEGIIAEILSFKVNDQFGNENDVFELTEPITIDVKYAVYDTNLKNPVIGIAVLGADDDYVCGLNTLLDHISLPWNLGENNISLEYYEGIRAIGGKYSFNVAIFEETATVPIQYLTRIKEITVYSEYTGEGRYIIPHKWEVKK
ncbi:MAG: teichoic acid ABC transporter ATP-binding protein [Epulopiscium sp. Nele67-Bin004]|nr:MAG: teichoic acid ABC transporter ATP-binding protein [Epulopiscium sp. Nele67-Bin004]